MFYKDCRAEGVSLLAVFVLRIFGFMLELAEAVGVSRQTINFIETGRYMPSTIVALKIAKYFGRHADEIFQLEEND